MKKLIATALILGSTALFASAADTKPVSSNLSSISASTAVSVNAEPQRWNRWNRQRRVRVVTRTRVVGRFRETIRTTYYPNGRVVTRVIRRARF